MRFEEVRRSPHREPAVWVRVRKFVDFSEFVESDAANEVTEHSGVTAEVCSISTWVSSLLILMVGRNDRAGADLDVGATSSIDSVSGTREA